MVVTLDQTENGTEITNKIHEPTANILEDYLDEALEVRAQISGYF